MLKKILLLSCGLSPLGLNAQDVFEDYVDLGPTTIPALTYMVNDWGNTHGTPTYEPTNLTMWHANDGYTDIGEGVFRLFDIRPKMKYYFSFQFRNFLIPPPHLKAEINIWLTKINTPNTSSSFGEPIPIITPKRVISWTEHVNTPGPFFIHKALITSYDEQAWKSLVFYPNVKTLSDWSKRVLLSLDCVFVRECSLANDTTYCGELIPFGLLNKHHNIKIGSRFCNLAEITKNTSNRTTVIEGREWIDVDYNTEIEVMSGNTFTLEIHPVKRCDPEEANDTLRFPENVSLLYPCIENGDILSQRSAHRSNEQNYSTTLAVYPNPANNQINFSYNVAKAGKVSAKVTDLTGRVVMTKDFGTVASGEQTFNLSVADLPNGNYALEVITSENRGVSKFTIAK